VWKPGSPTGINISLPGIMPEADDMNDQGHIIGTYSKYNCADHIKRTSFLLAESLSELACPNVSIDNGYCSPSAINNHDVIVGYESNATSQYKPVLWKPGSLMGINLNTIIDTSYVTTIVATPLDINNNGIIYAKRSTGGSVLLIPLTLPPGGQTGPSAP
jgi:hypothetical protein